MGHTRLGTIPKTRKWKQLVALMAGERGLQVGPKGTLAGAVEDVAARALALTETGLDSAIDDKGLQYTFYLLTQLVLAAREVDWQSRLQVFGVHIADDASTFELTMELQSAIDDYLLRHSRPTDISEIAQQAIGEAVSTLAGPRSVTLFGQGAEELQHAVRAFSTKQGFAELGQEFFSSFMTRFLNFYLSRATAAQAGGEMLQQVGDISEFNSALSKHCRQTARIVHDYCGEWYSKTEFTQGISLDNTSRFMAIAVKKLQSELRQQGAAS